MPNGSLMSPPWMTLVAGIGIGTVIAAVVSARMNKAVAIAGHRQAWINALRDHLSDYFYLIDRLAAARSRKDTNGPSALKEAQQIAEKEYRQILLRLNAGEPQHTDLANILHSLLDDAEQENLAIAMRLSRAVLKREWEVTKGWTIKRIWRIGPGRIINRLSRNPVE